MTVVKNSMGGLNSKIKGTQDWTGELEDRMKEITRPEKQRKNWKKNEQSPRAIYETLTKDLTFVSSKSPEGREMSSIEKVLEEIMAEKFQSVAKHIKPQVQKAAQTTNRINSKKCTHRCITVKLLKTKREKNLKSNEIEMAAYL